MAERWNCKFVVGINIGSEYSGYAFSVSDIKCIPPEIYTAKWRGKGRFVESCKCPTSILLDQDEEMVAFGYQAETEYLSLLVDDKHHEYYYFKHVRNSIHQVFQLLLFCVLKNAKIIY